MSNGKRLTDAEEDIVINYTLDLHSRFFDVAPEHVEAKANKLLRDRDARPVGDAWATSFVRRHPAVDSILERGKGQQLNRDEPLPAYRSWLHLLRDVVIKYAIQPDDIYACDDIRFRLGPVATKDDSLCSLQDR